MEKKEKLLKLIKLYIKNFTSKNISLLANNLTYVMLLTIFPFLAIVIGISKGFGLDEKILIKLKDIIPKDESMLNYIVDVTNNLIENAKGGLLTGFGIIILMFSVIFMLNLLEDTFNDIWNVKNQRKFISKIVSYIAIIFISPIFILLIIASSSIIVDIIFNVFGFISESIFIVIKLINLILTTILITIMFLIIPNRRVRLKPALIGSMITVIGLYVLSFVYNLLQSSLNQYNVIYGSIAFIPIFLIWIKYAWTIILIGSQITYTIQTSQEIIDDKLNISPSINKRIGIYLFKLMTNRFILNQSPYSIKELSSESGISQNIITKILENLNDLELVVEISNDEYEQVYYQINKNPSITSIKYLYNIIDGKNLEFEKSLFENQNENQKEIYLKILNEIEIKNDKTIDED